MVSNVSKAPTGGAARIMYSLRNEFLKLGHQADLIFIEDVPDPLRRCGLGNLTFPFFMLLPLWRFTRARGPYDIVNIQLLSGAVYAWLRTISKRLPKCVGMSYGADELRWEMEKEEARLGLRPLGLKSRILYYHLVIRQSRYTVRHADHVLTAAAAERVFFESSYHMNPGRISVIPFGVDPVFFIDRNYRRPATKLLFLGGWEWRKGIRYLIETFSAISEQHPQITLSLAGTGQDERSVKASFPKHLHSRVQVIPRIRPEDLSRVYAEHDVFLFPSLFEGEPLVIPEAMASGMPIVTTRTCGMQDAIEDDISGFLVPPRNSEALGRRTLELLRDPSLRERLGRAAQQRARDLTWDRIARQTIQIYRGITHR